MGVPDGSGKIKIQSSKPIISSAKRALTTSFGSICFGSLVIAIIQTIRALVRSVRDGNTRNAALVFLACIAECLLQCIQSWIEFLNVVLLFLKKVCIYPSCNLREGLLLSS